MQKKKSSKETITQKNVNMNIDVWFYGISTPVGYLMPTPFYTYTLNI